MDLKEKLKDENYQKTVGFYVEVLYPVFLDDYECMVYSEMAYALKLNANELRGHNIEYIVPFIERRYKAYEKQRAFTEGKRYSQ